MPKLGSPFFIRANWILSDEGLTLKIERLKGYCHDNFGAY